MVRGYVVGSRRESISDVGWYPDLYLATQLDFWDAIASGSGHISVFKDGPHPNAAQLYVNWFLSRHGQQLAEAHRKKLISHGYSQGHARIPGVTGPQRVRQVHADEFGEIRRHRAGAKIGRGTFRGRKEAVAGNMQRQVLH
jgi:hypothetical protein